MSFLKRLLGRNDPPKQRIRICVECGMPPAEHKDWCAIRRGQTEQSRTVVSPDGESPSSRR